MKYAIVIYNYFGAHRNGYFTKTSEFTEDLQMAAVWETPDKAYDAAKEIMPLGKSFAVLPVDTSELENTVDGDLAFPAPDYFEATSYMTVAELIQALRTEDPTTYFTPVKSITGGNQMTGSGVPDELTGQLVGRKFTFSFSKLLPDNDVSELYEAIRHTHRYSRYSYQQVRSGFTAYAVLELIAPNR